MKKIKFSVTFVFKLLRKPLCECLKGKSLFKKTEKKVYELPL